VTKLAFKKATKMKTNDDEGQPTLKQSRAQKSHRQYRAWLFHNRLRSLLFGHLQDHLVQTDIAVIVRHQSMQRLVSLVPTCRTKDFSDILEAQSIAAFDDKDIHNACQCRKFFFSKASTTME